MCLPKANRQRSTESIGHFDPFDLVRRLEAHQAYCREGYRLRQQKAKERQAAKRLAAEKDARSTEMDVVGSTLGHRGKIEQRPNASTTIQGTGPDVVIAKLAVLRHHRNQSQDTRTRRRKSRPSSIKGSSNQASYDRARHLKRPSYVLADKPKQTSQRPADARHDQIKKEGGWKESTGVSQPFKIYTQESSVKIRPTVTVMSISNKTERKSGFTSGNGTYVPKNAALGLAVTTAHCIDERGKLIRSLSENRPSYSGAGMQPRRITTQNVNQRSSMPTLRTSSKEDQTFDTSNRKPTSAKLIKVDEEMGNTVQQNATAETTTQLVGSSNGNEVRLPNNDSTEHKEQQRRTLREKISRMRLLGRRIHEEDAVALPQTSPEKEKPAIPRRKSMRLMFR